MLPSLLPRFVRCFDFRIADPSSIDPILKTSLNISMVGNNCSNICHLLDSYIYLNFYYIYSLHQWFPLFCLIKILKFIRLSSWKRWKCQQRSRWEWKFTRITCTWGIKFKVLSHRCTKGSKKIDWIADKDRPWSAIWWGRQSMVQCYQGIPFDIS